MLTLPRSGQPEPGAPPRQRTERGAGGGIRAWLAGWFASGGAATFIVVAGVTAFVIGELQPGLLFSPNMDVGGDNAAHVVAVDYFIHHLLPHGQLSGWDPQWFGGFPLYVFYFPLPPLLAAFFNLFTSYAVAFKLVTVAGTVLTPVAAWTFGRLAGFRRPIPALMAVAMLAFLFNTSYTIDGGNIVSTMAGEFSFSLALAFALFFLGVFSLALRTGRWRWLAALLFFCTALSHVVPSLFAAGAAALLALARIDRRAGRAARAQLRADPPGPGASWRARLAYRRALVPQPLVVLVSVGIVGGLLGAFWLAPFAAYLRYSASMGYTRVTGLGANFFPGPAMDAIEALAAVGVLVALVRRQRVALVLAVLTGCELAAFFFLPDGLVYNARWLPFWYLTTCLLAAYALGEMARLLPRVRWWSALGAVGVLAVVGFVVRPGGGFDSARWLPLWLVAGALLAAYVATLTVRFVLGGGGTVDWAAAVSPLVLGLAALGVTAAYCGVLPGYQTAAGSIDEAPSWVTFNYTGYQGKPGWPEFHTLVQMLERVARTHGCGRLDYEYSPNTTNAYGSTLVPMSFPMWTNGCIQSEEGVYYESSTAIYYHFLDQAELSLNPSNPVSGLPYQALDVPDGIRHLQLTGVKYFLASSPTVEQEAAADPALVEVGTAPESASVVDRTAGSTQPPASSTFSYVLYEIRDAPLVAPLVRQPVVEHLSQLGWRSTSISWYQSEMNWPVEIAASGPASWPVEKPGTLLPPAAARALPPTAVSHVAMGDQNVSFDVTRLGVPVLVKVPYFPAWHVTGALGPYEGTPNLMIVVPTRHHVTLTYGPTAVDWAGRAASLVGVAGLVALRGAVPPPPALEPESVEDAAPTAEGGDGAGGPEPGGPERPGGPEPDGPGLGGPAAGPGIGDDSARPGEGVHRGPDETWPGTSADQPWGFR